MEFMSLKAPPDRVRLIANAIEREMSLTDDLQQMRELREVLTWLNYRLAKWDAAHLPSTTE